MTLEAYPSSNKVALRSILRERRQRHDLEDKNPRLFGGETAAKLFAVVDHADCIGGYVKAKFEADPSAILLHAAKQGTKIALPYIARRDVAMEFRHWGISDALEPAPYGFDQPLATAGHVVPDVVLVPVVGFDRAMTRLGQGAGHYDQYFSKYISILRIGLAFTFQEVDHIPADVWDIPLDAILTEKEWIVGPKSRIAS
jgi:5-formyltetrahydrofolate cyclo-ligase